MFYAQFDLSDIAAIWPETVLPTTGSLAFFSATSGPVLYIPEGEATEDTPPPGPVDYSRFTVDIPIGHDRPMRWPVGFMASPTVATDDTDQAAERFADFVKAHFHVETPSIHDLITTQSAKEDQADVPIWWHAVQNFAHYAATLPDEVEAKCAELQDKIEHGVERIEIEKGGLFLEKEQYVKTFGEPFVTTITKPTGFARLKALLVRGNKTQKNESRGFLSLLEGTISNLEHRIELCDKRLSAAQREETAAQGKLLRLQRAKGPFVQISRAFDRLVAGTDPLAHLTEADKAQFMALYAAMIETAKATADDAFGLGALIRIKNFEDFNEDTLRILLTSDSRAYASIPAATREAVNQSLLLPCEHYFNHMLGRRLTAEWSDEHDTETGKTRLLQITSDHLLKWQLSHDEFVSFWINDKDLKARNWSAVEIVFN